MKMLTDFTSLPYQRRTSAVIALWLSLAVLALPSTAAELDSVVLSTQGQIASLDSVAASPAQSRLVLSIADETVNVPGSLSESTTPLGLVSSQTGELHVFWLSTANDVSHLWMSTRLESDWDGPHALMAGGEPVAFATAPRLMVDGDRLSLSFPDSDAIEFERQIVHVVWQENGTGTRYSSFIIRNGRYVGWNEIVTVSSAYRQAHADAEPNEIPASLADHSAIVEAEKGGVLLTLTDDDRSRIGTIRVGPVSLGSEILGDSIYEGMLDSAEVFDPDDLSSLADEMGGHIIMVGSLLDLDAAMASFFSERIASWLHEHGSDFGWQLDALADATRGESLDLSQSVYQSSLQVDDGYEIPVFDLVDFLDGNGHRDEFSRLMRLSVVADLAAPAHVGDDIEVHVSPDGSALALSWLDADTGTVRWTEGRHGAWSESKSLATSDDTDEAAIRQLISESIR